MAHELDGLKIQIDILSNRKKGEKIPDLTGMVFGRLKVLRHNKKEVGRSTWFCVCECGNNKEVLGKVLVRGGVKSCGCLQKDTKSNLRHNLCHTSEYHAWQGVKDRCLNEKNYDYPDYGGRGIGLTKEWRGKKGFVAFLRDMGLKPTPKHTIDRIDVNGDYCKENCRWATQKQQSRNKRNTVYLTINGETKSISEWAEIAKNVSSMVIYDRKRKGTLSDYDCVYKPNKYPNGSPKKGIKLKK